MRIITKAFTAIVAVCLIATTAACGSPSSDGSKGSGASKSLTVGYVAYTLAATPQQDLKKGSEEQAKKYGYTLKTVESQGSADKANSLIQSFVTQGVDAIVVDSYGADSLTAGIMAATSKKIPVYLAYAPADSDSAAGVVQVNAGTETADLMVKDLGNSGSVLAFTLPAGPNCASSEKQFDDVMAKNPGWKVQKQQVAVPGWEQAAATTTTGWLKSHPKGSPLAIWSCWDGPGVGAASALKQAGRDDVNLYGQNTDAATIALLEKGQYTASYYFDSVALGRRMLDLVHANAGTPLGDIKHTFERFPKILVDQETLTDFLAKYPQVKG